jgi:hypothetical protein
MTSKLVHHLFSPSKMKMRILNLIIKMATCNLQMINIQIFHCRFVRWQPIGDNFFWFTILRNQLFQ